jgi:hypothetical protein
MTTIERNRSDSCLVQQLSDWAIENIADLQLLNY